MTHVIQTIVLLLGLILAPLLVFAQGFDVNQSGVTLTVIYVEPDTEMDNTTPLTDLAFTRIVVKDADAIIETRDVPAVEVAGGKRIEQTFPVSVTRGQTKNIEVTVTAFDVAGNESDPVMVSKVIDRIPPGQVKKAQ